jgi:hypothetical protein
MGHLQLAGAVQSRPGDVAGSETPPERGIIYYKEQSKMFIEKAREIEADEKRSAADKLMGRLAKMKPQPKSEK